LTLKRPVEPGRGISDTSRATAFGLFSEITRSGDCMGPANSEQIDLKSRSSAPLGKWVPKRWNRIARRSFIGWRPYTIVKTLGSERTIVLKGTFETFLPHYCPTDEQQLRRFQLQKAARESGADFYQQTGARLFELGKIHYE
jgi:hypothetical protein